MLLMLFVGSAAAGQVTCVDPYDSDHLQMAVDAALMELQGTSGWFHELRSTNGFNSALSVSSCTADATKWTYPTEVEATGLLKRVLESGELKVAGVQWSIPGVADYKTDPDSPTGFWPEYLTAIAEKLSTHYGKTITVARTYYPTSVLVIAAVAAGEDVDMSEPYYYISGFHNDVPRIESLDFSCITAAVASKFFTLKGEGITTTDELYDEITKGPNRAVGFIGKGNYDAVSALLPSTTSPSYVTNNTDMEANVLSGALVGGYISESEVSDASLFDTFETGIISPRVALFRKTDKECTADEVECTDDDEKFITILIVLAAVILVLATTLGYIISMERKGSPMFMPLLNTLPVAATSATATKDAV